MTEAENYRQELSIREKMYDWGIATDARIEKECTGTDGVLDREMANLMKHTYLLINGDYMNEYIGAVWTLLSPDRKAIIEKVKKEIGSFKVHGFTERYEKLELTVSSSDQEKIKKLDDLAGEANRLIDEPFLNMAAFVDIAIAAAEICEHPISAEGFKTCLQEVLGTEPSLT